MPVAGPQVFGPGLHAMPPLQPVHVVAELARVLDEVLRVIVWPADGIRGETVFLAGHQRFVVPVEVVQPAFTSLTRLVPMVFVHVPKTA